MSKLMMRKERMFDFVFNGDYSSSDALIYKFLLKTTLDDLIIQLNDEQTKCIRSNICNYTRKGFLTSEEQFLNLLNVFILNFRRKFYFLGSVDNYVLETIFSNSKNCEVFLSKKYYHDNNNIEYYTYNFEKMTIMNFYENLKVITKINDKVNEFLKQKKINIDKMNLKREKEVNKLYKLLRELSLANNDDWCCYFLFSNFHKEIEEIKNKYSIGNNTADCTKNVLENYAFQYESAIKNYNRKKDALNILLK